MEQSQQQQQDHHSHKARKAGRGAKERKKEQLQRHKDVDVDGPTGTKDNKNKNNNNTNNKNNRNNPRANSVANIGRTKRTIQRNLDKSQQKEYVPLDDRRRQAMESNISSTATTTAGTTTTTTTATVNTPPPPSVVVVMGPTGVGKSTLIRSLVKLYTNQNLSAVTGPITVVTSSSNSNSNLNNKRITLLECSTDARHATAAMLDCAKIADLVLLCVDAKFGFEMETMEFLNILQTHGFPKVVGIFTHLDQFGKGAHKSVRSAKKQLKQRFWTDIYQGAKMFTFSGVIHGKYLKNEVKQLTLLISRVKVRCAVCVFVLQIGMAAYQTVLILTKMKRNSSKSFHFGDVPRKLLLLGLRMIVSCTEQTNPRMCFVFLLFLLSLFLDCVKASMYLSFSTFCFPTAQTF